MITSNPGLKILYHGQRGDWDDITESVVSFQSQSSLSQGFTTFNFILKNDRASWKNVICPMDMVKIWLSNGQSTKPVLMPGFISRVQDDYSLAKGTISNNTNISGMDAGKFMMKRDVVYMPYIGYTGLQELMKQMPIDGTSEDIVKKLIKFMVYQPNVQLVDGHTIARWFDVEDYVKSVSKDVGYDWKIFEQFSFYFSPGNVWQLVKQYSNPVLNEIFTQAGEDHTYLVLRQRPFHSTDWPNAWTDLKAKWFGKFEIDFSDGAIIRRSLGISDDDTFNFWAITNQIGGLSNEDTIASLQGGGTAGMINGKKINLPIYDGESARQYGLRPHIASTPFIPVKKQENEQNCLQGMRLATCRVFEWFCLNDLFENGSITIFGGEPGLYTGMPVIDKKSNMEYYCEGVNHGYTPGNLTTTANLTRGRVPSDLISLKQYKMEFLNIL